MDSDSDTSISRVCECEDENQGVATITILGKEMRENSVQRLLEPYGRDGGQRLVKAGGVSLMMGHHPLCIGTDGKRQGWERLN